MHNFFQRPVGARRNSLLRYVFGLILFALLFIAIKLILFGLPDKPEARSSYKATQKAERSTRSRTVTSARETRSDRSISEPSFATADHPEVKAVIKLVQEFEKSRTEITFNSHINGRKKVFMETAKPSEDELMKIREAAAEISELRKMQNGQEVRWSDFIEEQFYLQSPTSYTVMVGESGGFITYSISPIDSGNSLPKIRGSVKMRDLKDGDVTWRFSHLISLGEEESQEPDLE